jgi:hypothetical protein
MAMAAIGSARKGDRRCVSDWQTLRGVTSATLISVENGYYQFIFCN